MILKKLIKELKKLGNLNGSFLELPVYVSVNENTALMIGQIKIMQLDNENKTKLVVLYPQIKEGENK